MAVEIPFSERINLYDNFIFMTSLTAIGNSRLFIENGQFPKLFSGFAFFT